MRIERVFGKSFRCAELLTLALLAGVILSPASARAQVEYVDPTIGNVSILLVPTRPAVFMPNSMVRVYPMRADALDDRIDSFPLTISSHRALELFSIMPGDGSPAAYDQEKTTPYYFCAPSMGALLRVQVPSQAGHSE